MSNMAASGEDVVGGDIERQKTIEVDEGIDELLSVLCHRTIYFDKYPIDRLFMF